jgi:hypothetical protein
MIDKKLYELILGKLNDATINTQGVTFKGNYVFVRYNDTQTLMEASTYNAYDLKQTVYIGMAEITSVPTDFVEKNNRTDFVKEYAFQFPVRMQDKALEALQEVFLYFRTNNVQTVVDNVTYKVLIKPHRPRFLGNQQQAGGIDATYGMSFFITLIETGEFTNTATHEMSISGGTLQDLFIDAVNITNQTAVSSSNLLTSESNTKSEPISRSLSFTFTIYYDSSTLLETILGVVEGKTSRETLFTYQKTFDSVVRSWDIYITGGNVIYKNGLIHQITFNGTEK